VFITITREGWLSTLKPAHVRQQMTRNVFDSAKKHGWTVRLEGERW
jgi:hypothetical protein